jgi:hypothetical protein
MSISSDDVIDCTALGLKTSADLSSEKAKGLVKKRNRNRT